MSKAKSAAAKHILMMVENLPVPLDRRVWQEANALRAAGYKVTVLCPQLKGFNTPYEELEGITIHRYPLPMEARGFAGYLVEYGGALFQLLKLAFTVYAKNRFHAVHICNPPDLLFLCTLPFRLLGVKVVFDHHDLCPELFAEKFGEHHPLIRVMRFLEWLTFKTAHQVISTNESFKRIAITRGGKAADDIYIVRSSPDTTRLTRVKPRAAWRKKAKFMGMYVGIMGSQDGVDILLRAVAHLRKNGVKGYQFLLVGDGPEKPALEALAAELKITDSVTFTGYLSGEDLKAAFSTADFGVCPDPKNPFNDKLTMNKILEYMAYNLPMVQFDLAESRIISGETAVYASNNSPVSLAQKILELTSDEAKMEKLGKAGNKRLMESLAWPHQVKELLRCYANLFKAG